jgi:hypothetical protein
VAGAPNYDPAVVTDDAGYFFSLYPYYGYAGYTGFFPTSYPNLMDDKTSTGERGG